MSTVEKISIALPPEMVAVVRSAVETGEYASSSEVVRDALRDWTQKRRLRQQGIEELRQVWQQAIKDQTPGVPADDVLNRLERKYQAMADKIPRARPRDAEGSDDISTKPPVICRLRVISSKMMPEFEWDEDKAATNWRDHGVAFHEAIQAFRDTFAVERIDDREDYGEERINLIGMCEGVILHVTYTERSERIRIISARRAERDEQDDYYRENSP